MRKSPSLCALALKACRAATEGSSRVVIFKVPGIAADLYIGEMLVASYNKASRTVAIRDGGHRTNAVREHLNAVFAVFDIPLRIEQSGRVWTMRCTATGTSQPWDGEHDYLIGAGGDLEFLT